MFWFGIALAVGLVALGYGEGRHGAPGFAGLAYFSALMVLGAVVFL
jgi:hypothetical protein